MNTNYLNQQIDILFLIYMRKLIPSFGSYFFRKEDYFSAYFLPRRSIIILQKYMIKQKMKNSSLCQIKTEPLESEQCFNDPHLNSSLLPKIHRTTVINKIRNKDQELSHSANVVVLKEEQIQKRKKMAMIVFDYLQNYKNRQKGSIVAISTPNEKLTRSPIKVEGISHGKFVNSSYFTPQKDHKKTSLDIKRKYRIKVAQSILQKIKNQGKEEWKRYRSKFFTEEDRDQNIESSTDLKGYILKAKKSVFDVRRQSINKQRRNITKKSSFGQVEPW